PERGIYLVEKEIKMIGEKKGEENDIQKENFSQKKISKKERKKESDLSNIHIGRKKDPAELYFKSGLEYYKNSDFENALKNFLHADSMEEKAEYRLWIGKTYRRLEKIGDFLKTMFEIVKKEPESDVADDALFELALYYKSEDDYEKATQLFSQLIEQYPFGTAYGTGEELREIAREQRRLMRAEMINLLTILGYKGEDLPTSYLNFQKANNLPLTEKGDKRTVKAIKEMHRLYLQKEEEKAKDSIKRNHLKMWMIVVSSIGFVNITMSIVMISKIFSKLTHAEELHKILLEAKLKIL
ncbi:MAG: hypothetical protein N2053_07120, partial [Chitinispirillaceae bacterium]|nr:hypothetical protein [Chitinispirillaceae bacterium]